MGKKEIASEKFKDGYNCAQSVLFSYAEKLNLPKDTALKIANGFGGGMGRKQEVCGAVSGGVMVLSLIYGRGENEDKSKQGLTYAKVRELIDKFEAKYETANCKELLGGIELLTPEGIAAFQEQKKIENCREFVEYTVKILDEIIENDSAGK